MVIIAGALALAGGSACGRPGGEGQGSGSTFTGAPIVVVSIDTLRADHLPAYGYKAVATPAIDALRRDSILFDNAYSHVPLTLPSHVSLLTGLLPPRHGVRNNLGYRLDADAHPTLARRLKARGYATGAAVSAYVLRGETGLSDGFDWYDDALETPDAEAESAALVRRPGADSVRLALQWVAGVGRRPYLLFVHLYEPHFPYQPPEPFHSRYPLAYDGAIAAADAAVGMLFEGLKRDGSYDRAVIVLLSDHGEGLGDHGEDEHGILLYREVLQVPLMLKLPKSTKHGTSIATPVQLVDIFATLAAGQKSEGKSLLGNLAGERPIYAETYYPRFHFGWSDLHSLISGPNHYIQAPKPELYDLAADPRESKNVLQENRRTYAALREAIASYVKGAEAPKAIDPEQARQLAALGYVGSTVSTTSTAQLPDPKDRISGAGEINQGFRAFQEQRYDDAARILGALLRQNPNMVDLWMLQTRALEKLGRREEAIGAARQGLRISPTATQLAIALANLSLEMNRPDDAEKHAQLAMKDLPNEAHYLLAQVWIARKDYVRARQDAEASRGSRPDRPASLMLLGQIEKEQGHLDAALRYFDQANAVLQAKQRPPVEGLNFYRGDTLARLGRAEEAEDAFRREIAQYPTDPQAYKNLILLYVTEGKNAAATQLIFALEKAAPVPPSYVAISETLKTIGDRNGARFWAARGLSRFPRDRQLQALLRG